ncbi:MAG: YwaF family protein [Oscillospiraceae bacterium]|jgi:hypothetical protein|nr:YwaF family protein [Oscillospiraceae bacterium]
MTPQMLTFNIISLSLIVIICVVLRCTVKDHKGKVAALRVFAWLTFLLHISIMWETSLYNNATGEAPRSVLYPLYHCNVVMYLLMVVAYLPQDKKAFKFLAPFVSLGGVLGGLLTTFTYMFPIWNDAGQFSYEQAKSTFSHITMILACLWMLCGGMVKLRVKSIPSIIAMLLLEGANGLIFNFLLTRSIKGQVIYADANAMWLRFPIIGDNKALMGYFIGIYAAVVFSLVCLIWELVAVASARKKGINEPYSWKKQAVADYND